MLDRRLFDPLAVGVAHPSPVANADVSAGAVVDELDQLTSQPNGLLTSVELNGESPVFVEVPNDCESGNRRRGNPVDSTDQTRETRFLGLWGGCRGSAESPQS